MEALRKIDAILNLIDTINTSASIITSGHQKYPLIIVGSGLAGHAAAAQALSILKLKNLCESHPIIVFEKEPKFGGNSFKATSGINGANTEFQALTDIKDDVKDFTSDTLYSSIGGKNNYNSQTPNKLITTLTTSSASAVNWLKNEFDLKLTAISQCGGHSHPRTHRPPAGGVGYTIVKTIHDKIENDVEFRYNCQVLELLLDNESKTKTVIGIKYRDVTQNKIINFHGAGVILACGGFGNDHSSTSLLAQYATQKEDILPTTNGKWCTGDAVKMGRKIGVKLVDMSQIQVHPTGFINPNKPNDTTKFLAPEALRGYGAIMINNDGKRFVNELDLRANVVEKMKRQELENKMPFRLLLNDNVKQAFGPNIGFYMKIGLIKEYENIQILSKDIGINDKVLKETILKYVECAKVRKDDFGKTLFLNADGYDVEGKIYVAEITPVVHYTMGGLAINEMGQVLDVNDDIINGLYGAGECTGGVHGKNRLAGNSLLECTVYGRIVGKGITQYCLNVNKRK